MKEILNALNLLQDSLKIKVDFVHYYQIRINSRTSIQILAVFSLTNI